MKKVLSAVLAAIMVFGIISTLGVQSGEYTAYAASGKKITKTYNDVIKSGNKVYCSFGNRISVVNLKKGKVRSIVNPGLEDYTPEVQNMMLYKGYIYFITDCHVDSYNFLSRVKLSSGKTTYLYPFVKKYMIKNKKIYLVGFDDEDYDSIPDKTFKRVMKLNGKSVKKTKAKITMTTKKRNKKGYKIVKKYSGVSDVGSVYKFWLKTPKGKKYYLGEAAQCNY